MYSTPSESRQAPTHNYTERQLGSRVQFHVRLQFCSSVQLIGCCSHSTSHIHGLIRHQRQQFCPPCVMCLQVCVYIYQLTGFIMFTCRDGAHSSPGPNLACQLFNFWHTSCYQKLTHLIINKASASRPSPQQFLISCIDTLFHSAR